MKLLTANAQSQFSKQISDVQNLLAKGADLLVIAPLNSDGWDPVLQAAAAKKVPIITIDRKINAQPCKDYVSFIASDFVEQGRRAADQMIEATGGKGEVAIPARLGRKQRHHRAHQGLQGTDRGEGPGPEGRLRADR